ncbi:methyltransferase family protein [Aliihoeflea sp. PC F10.4]
MSDDQVSSLARFQRMRRLVLAILIVSASLVLMIVRSSLSERAHEFVEAFGLGLIGAAILGRLWCTVHIGGRKSAQVVDSGPYSISRNPLYVFSAIAAVGVGAQTGSLVVAAFFGVATVAAFHIVILREERFLSEKFGTEYADYLARVPRFWPRFSIYSDVETVVARPALLYRTLSDGLVFFLAVPAFESIEWAQSAGYLPVLLRLP